MFLKDGKTKIEGPYFGKDIFSVSFHEGQREGKREGEREGRGEERGGANSFIYKDNGINLLVRVVPMTCTPPIRSSPHSTLPHWALSFQYMN